MSYTVTGRVPARVADLPAYNHHESTAPGKNRKVADAGRPISVTTEHLATARALEAVFAAVLEEVTVS